MNLKSGDRVLIRPTMREQWMSYHAGDKAWKYLDDGAYIHAVFNRKLKEHFVFMSLHTSEKWKMPFHAVEIYRLINKPMNEDVIEHHAREACKKFKKGGFDVLTDKELLMIMAHLETNKWSKRTKEYPMKIALGLVPSFRKRVDIIRTLRNTYSFRNTVEDRKYCLEDHFF